MPLPFFRTLRQVASWLDQCQCAIVRAVRWLILAMTITVCLIIIGRLFDIGSIALQESVSYMHACLFMLSIAYTAYQGGHVRVDIIYRRFSALNQAWLNLFGACFFLLPFALFLFFISWQSALQSWSIQESSNNPGGLALVFILKSLTPLTGILLLLHSISEIFKQLCTVSLKEIIE